MKTKEVPTGVMKMRQITELLKGWSQKETLKVTWPNPPAKANSLRAVYKALHLGRL